MRVATILPSAYLHLTETDDYHLCLAQAIGVDERYTAFYKRIAAEDKFVILDNGAAEGELPTIEELYDKAIMLGASEIILPDVMFDTKATLEEGYKAIDYLSKKKHYFEVMAVPQGKTLEDWMSCALEMLKWPITSVGIPKNLVRTGGYFGRLRALKTFLKLKSARGVGIHLLGCWEDPREVAIINSIIEGIRGVDSRMPYLYAAEGKVLDPDTHEKPKSMDFDSTDATVSHSLLESNIARWRRYCSGDLF